VSIDASSDCCLGQARSHLGGTGDIIFPTVALPFFLLKYLLHGFPGLFTVISGHICFLLLVFLFLHFLVVGSVR